MKYAWMSEGLEFLTLKYHLTIRCMTTGQFRLAMAGLQINPEPFQQRGLIKIYSTKYFLITD